MWEWILYDKDTDSFPLSWYRSDYILHRSGDTRQYLGQSTSHAPEINRIGRVQAFPQDQGAQRDSSPGLYLVFTVFLTSVSGQRTSFSGFSALRRKSELLWLVHTRVEVELSTSKSNVLNNRIRCRSRKYSFDFVDFDFCRQFWRRRFRLCSHKIRYLIVRIQQI